MPKLTTPGTPFLLEDSLTDATETLFADPGDTFGTDAESPDYGFDDFTPAEHAEYAEYLADVARAEADIARIEAEAAAADEAEMLDDMARRYDADPYSDLHIGDPIAKMIIQDLCCKGGAENA